MNSTDVQKEIRDRWNRTLAICGSIGVPLVSVAIWLIVSGTKLVDKVDVSPVNKMPLFKFPDANKFAITYSP